MSFYLPSAQPVAESPSRSSTDEDAPTSALHAALHTFTSSGSPHHSPQVADDHEGVPEKSKTGLDIVFNPEPVCLKGTGPDVEPALLSGYVVLHLTESASIREITLSFRGKAKLPVPSH